MPRTPEQSADDLGIAPEHLDHFVAMVDLMRTPEAKNAELERLRDEMGRINHVLHEAGFDYPQGVRGVKDLAMGFEGARDEADTLRAEVVTLKAEVARLKQAGEQLVSIDKTLGELGIEKKGASGLWRLAVLYEDARDKAAEQDLKTLREGVDKVLEGRGYTQRGVAGVRQLSEHDEVLAEDIVATNALLERAGITRHAGSRGVHELVERLKAEVEHLKAAVDKEWTDKVWALKALELVGKPKSQTPTPSVIDRMGAFIADGHLVFEKDTEGEQA